MSFSNGPNMKCNSLHPSLPPPHPFFFKKSSICLWRETEKDGARAKPVQSFKNDSTKPPFFFVKIWSDVIKFVIMNNYE